MDKRSKQFSDCMCRTCMQELVEVFSDTVSTKPAQPWQSIFDTIEECASLPIAELLCSTIPKIEVHLTDGLPKKICRKCLEQLRTLYQFQQMCLQSQRRMHDLIDKKTITETAAEQKIITNELAEHEFVAEAKAPSIEFGLVDHISEATQPSAVTAAAADPLQSIDYSDDVKHEDESGDDGSNIVYSDGETMPSAITLKNEPVAAETLKATEQQVSDHSLTFDCTLCKKSFQKSRYLASHLKRHKQREEPEKPKDESAYFRFKCDICQRRFHKQQSLDLHRSTHDEKADNKEPTCDICNRTYSTRHNLNKHKRLWHPTEKVPIEKPLHSCNSCGKTFKQLYLLTAHLRVHTGERPYLCPECGKAFKTAEQMRMHHLRHSDIKAYECPHCPLKFRCSGDVSKHKVIHRAVKRHVCDICGDRFAKSNQLTVHKRFHNGEKPFKCDYCEMRAVTAAAADPLQSIDYSDDVKHEDESGDDGSNIVYSDGETMPSAITLKNEPVAAETLKATEQQVSDHSLTFDCTLCKKSFQKSRYLASHLKRHKQREEPEKPKDESAYFRFKCDICQRRFHKQQSLDLHRSTHDEKADNKEPTCDICNRTYSTRHNLNKHKRLWHPTEKVPIEKPLHSCNSCGKTFKQLYLLTAHLRVHTGERPYLCPECGKAFKTAEQMRMHHLRHSDIKAYECPHCPLKFRCSGDVSKHKVIHRAVKRHVCDICGDRFAKSNQLTVHKRFHNGEKPFKCDYCEMRFVHTGPLQRHVRTHTGEKPYKCKYCTRAFAQSNDHVKHLRTHLGDNVYRCELCPSAFRFASELRVHIVTHKNEDEKTREQNLKALKEELEKLEIKLAEKQVPV